MESGIAITVENVSKKYCKSLKKSVLYGMADISRNMVGLSSHSERLRSSEFWALNDISFKVKRGEMLGLVGRNGSGKTTMLKLLSGILWPDRGRLTIEGRVGALIALGAGFHPQLTGRENISLNGAILGMSRMEIIRKFDSIVDFADIGDFLDSPVKYYSSGMYVRLGFAIAIHCQPDILLIDEVLSVGDVNFQSKCIKRMKDLERDGVTRIFVSHYLSSVQLLCKNTVYLQDGKIKYFGETNDVLNEFRKDMLEADTTDVDRGRFGTKEIEILKVEFLDEESIERKMFKRGGKLRLRICFVAKKPISDPEFSIGFFSQDGAMISYPTTRDHNVLTGFLEKEGEINYLIKSIPLNVGKYFISVGCWDSTGHVPYDQHEKLYELIVVDGAIDGASERFGYMYIPATWKIGDGSRRS